MSKLIEIDSLTIDDMRDLAREHDACEHAACESALEWMDKPGRTVQDVIDQVSVSGEYLCWAIHTTGGRVNLLPLQDAVIKRQGLWGLTYFAHYVLGADIDRILDEVIRRGNMQEVFEFSQNVPGVPQVRVQDALINGGNAMVMCLYARRVPGADRDRLQDAVIDSGNLSAMKGYAQHIPGADQDRLQAAIDKLEKPTCAN